MRAIIIALAVAGIICGAALFALGCEGAGMPGIVDGGHECARSCSFINGECIRTSDCCAIPRAIVECYKGRCVGTINDADMSVLPANQAPGSLCSYTGVCADGQCAASPWAPAESRYNVGCCVRGDVCHNAGEQAVCAFEIAYPENGFIRFCLDCGDGRGLRCGL